MLRWLVVPIVLVAAASITAQDVTFTIDTVHDRHQIPDAVYGVNDASIPGSTVHRYGATSGFAAWQQEQFAADASDPNLTGPLADPDRDGLANLVEYTTQRDPKSPSQNAPLQVTAPAGGASLQLQFQRRKGASDVQLPLQKFH